MYDDILIPTDGGDRFDRVIEQGLDLAAVSGATIHALSVVDDRAFLTLESDLESEVAQELEAEATEAIDAVSDAADTVDVSVESAIRTGDPAEEIRSYAAAEEIDCIVMGARSDNGRERALPGSVSQEVVAHSTTPVLTIPLIES